jgi:hypothetical protein
LQRRTASRGTLEKQSQGGNMSAVPVLKVSLLAAVFVAGFGNGVPLRAQEVIVQQATNPDSVKKKTFRVIREISVAQSSNSNLIIGTETRAKTDPLRDSIGNLAVTFGLEKIFPQQGNATLLFRFGNVSQQNVTTLRSQNLTVSAMATKFFGPKATLRFNGDFDSYAFYNFRDLSFNETRLRLEFERFTGLGLIYELGANFRNKRFHNRIANVVGFTLVNSRRAEVGIRLKYWQTRWLRLGGRYLLTWEGWDKTDSQYLQFLSGLTADERRNDFTHSVQPEITVVPFRQFAVTVGYQFQQNLANSDYYRFRAHSLVYQGTLKLGDSHVIFAEGSYGIVDYYRRRFDMRYLNTKEDFRTTFALQYDLRFMPFLYINAKYTYFANDSNDAIDFNPATSLTYSNFAQDVISVGARLDLTEVDLF